MTTLPSYPWRVAHLAALWAYGVAQPVFSMLEGNPEFLVVRGSTRTDVAVFAIALGLVPPLLVVGVEAIAGLASTTLARALHIVAVWCFSFLAALQLVRLFDPEQPIALLLPMIPAGIAALAYMRWRPFRSFLSISLVLPLLGLLAFVTTVPLAVDDRQGMDVEVRSRTPVVLVVFDEFPVSSLLRADGSLDGVRYPNFARLARESVWYPRATTVHASTTQAVPAILTGLHPRQGQLPTLTDHPTNLFTLLGERYSIRAAEQATRLCPVRYCPRTRDSVAFLDRERGLLYDTYVAYLHRVLPGQLRGQLPPIGQRWGGFGSAPGDDVRELVLGALDADDLNAAFARTRGRKAAQYQEFLQSLRTPSARRDLYFEHSVLPHSPWSFLPSGREYGDALWVEGIESDWVRWGPSARLVEQGLQRHLLQVGYVDLLVGQLLNRLKNVGLYDRALLVVTADHGAGFTPGGYLREVDREGLADIAAVPLFVKYPGQQRSRIDYRGAKTIDVLPTIADVIGVRIPWRVDGHSLRARPIERRVAVAGASTGTFSASVEAVAHDVGATARRNASLFGEGADSLYRLGPHKRLIGRPIESLSVSRRGGGRIHIDNVDQFEDVRTSSAFVPARIIGRIEDETVRAGSPLAIAVGGRVAVTTSAFEWGGAVAFATLVPESSFSDGQNVVDVYAIDTSGGDVRLRLLGGTPHAAQLESAGIDTKAVMRP